MFRLGYNTNGLAHHRVLDALRLLADLGYEGVAITPDVGQLDPYALDPALVSDTRDWAEELGLELAIETGARFLLDARRKHFPTLLEVSAEDRERRIDFLRRCIDLAEVLGAGVVSLWSGVAPNGSIADWPAAPDAPALGEDREALWDRLCTGLERVLAHGRGAGVQIGFEPEPGMFVSRPAGYRELLERMGSAGDELGLCLDVGHCLCTGDLPVPAVIREYAPRLVQVHLDDIRAGRHEHIMFGQGELDLAGTLAALIDAQYTGMAAVELSRDSHRGAGAAAEAMAHLREALGKGRAPGP